jgi:predicted DNA-binding transcriptional regulator YafY
MGLLHYSDRWHVLAWDRAKLEYRDFRTDRMHDLALLKQSFAPRKDFVLADHARRITDPKDKVTARVRFTPLAAERARREAFLGVAGEKLTADGIVMTLSAAAIDWLSNWLLSFGTAVTVLEPAYLRAHLADTARAVATHHTK